MEMAEEELEAGIAAEVDRATEEALVEAFNALRTKAEDSRRNLMIHRQAIGFKTDNFRKCIVLYPIGPARAAGVPKAEASYVDMISDNASKGEWLAWRYKKMSLSECKSYHALPNKAAKRSYLEALLALEER